MRRRVTIEVETPPPDRVTTTLPADTQPAIEEALLQVTVRVDKERLSAPERQVTTVSGALGIFNPRIPTEQGQRGLRVVGGHWVPLGRDPVFEAFLAERLRELPAALPPAQ
jgi:hypothetical protein